MNRNTWIKNIATTVLVVVVLLGAACSKDEVEKIDAGNRDSIAGMHSKKITTVISDSGITRYRIYTDEWHIYDKKIEPFWEFKKGIHFEKFDENLTIEAYFHADYAKFYEKKKLWEFRKNVKAINLKGEMFETDLLFWDQLLEKIYTPAFIKVTQETRINNWVGFESNQSLTKFHGTNATAEFVVDKENETNSTIATTEQ